ncbi:hypothetical protein Hamer_G002802 [Homarus americanus]|uniref:Uncharacterized protein n=1 Tax=Homarus americanus TaxID=6706 RepID=A0A8J5JSM0_HOMAM|nr:hypothetical protein Hamer_G002802 [Homarus americanus]
MTPLLKLEKISTKLRNYYFRGTLLFSLLSKQWMMWEEKGKSIVRSSQYCIYTVYFYPSRNYNIRVISSFLPSSHNKTKLFTHKNSSYSFSTKHLSSWENKVFVTLFFFYISTVSHFL